MELEPEQVQALLAENSCLLVDLRGEDRSAGLIEGAVHEAAIDSVPFPAKVMELVVRWAEHQLVVFTCQYSAHRAPQCANWYREKCDPRQGVAILAGGFRGWQAKGLPVKALATGRDAEIADRAALQLGSSFCDSVQSQEAECRRLGLEANRTQVVTPKEVDAETVPCLPSLGGSVESGLSQFGIACEQQSLSSLHVNRIEPQAVAELLAKKECLLVDVRSGDLSLGFIEGAVHEPTTDKFGFSLKARAMAKRWADHDFVVFVCQDSVQRAPRCAQQFQEEARRQQQVAVMTGGVIAWEAQGLPMQKVKEMKDRAEDVHVMMRGG